MICKYKANFCNEIHVFLKVYAKIVGYYINSQYLCTQLWKCKHVLVVF